jgi:hypothetical protein
MEVKTATQKVKEALADASQGLEIDARFGMYQERLGTLSAKELAAEMAGVEAASDYMDSIYKCLHAEYDLIRNKMLPDAMEKEGIASPMNLVGVGKIVLTADAFVAVKSGMKEQLFDWLRANNLGDLMKEDIASSTLKAFVKGRIRDGKEYPDDLINVTPVTRASITKLKS